MRTMRQLVWASLGLLCPGWLSAQPLVPVGDSVEEPLLPTGISDQPVEMFGALVYLWTEDDGSNVIHFVGEFELHLGRRRLKAREAVIWMTPREYQGRPYNHFDVFLWRDARVIEPAGTATTGPSLFATLNSSGKVTVSADRQTRESSRDTPLYAEAHRIRAQQLAAKPLPEPETGPPVTVVDLARERAPEVLRARPVISYRADTLTGEEEVSGLMVFTALGHVYLFRGDATGLDSVEIRADAAVIYLTPNGTGTTKESLGPEGPAPPGGEPPSPLGTMREPFGDLSEVVSPTGPGEMELSTGRVQSAYLEGDVLLSWGERTIRADRLYINFENDRALILDAVLFMPAPGRDIPIYVRAEQIRQYSRREWTATHARISTSEFYTPHYHIGASKVEFIDRTPRRVSGEELGPQAGTFKAYHTTFNIGGFPVAYWPYLQGDLEEEISPLRRARIGYSGDFGLEMETAWDLFSLLGLARPQGFEATLQLDYYTERGPGVGVNLDYERDNYFGLFRGYYVRDEGTDNLGRLRDDLEPDTPNRGRATWRHRQYLPDDWQLTLEASYISDRNFLEEWFEKEFDEGKEQETLVMLKKQRDNWAFTLLANFHILDFVSETEHLPDATFRLLGQPVGGVGTWFSENRAGFVRYRYRDQTLREWFLFGPREDSSGTTARGDTRQEVEFPFDLGPVRLVPFASIRGTAWDDSPKDGGIARVFGTYGTRASMYFARVYEHVKSEWFDIEGIRHIIKPDVTAWGAHTNVDSHELFPFDSTIEDIDEIDGVTVGVRQRWQTKRGGPERKRTVDLVTWDVEMGAFNDSQSFEFTNGFASFRRPEISISQNYVNNAITWRVSDSTAVISETNYDMNDGEIDVFDLSLAVERRPRLSYVVGYRYIGEIDSNLLGFGANYQISEKYILALREEFDLDRGDTLDSTVGVIRKLPRWYVGLTFNLDRAEDDLGVSLSAWPEGFPRAALGSRRFTGLATSTGLRPDR